MDSRCVRRASVSFQKPLQRSSGMSGGDGGVKLVSRETRASILSKEFRQRQCASARPIISTNREERYRSHSLIGSSSRSHLDPMLLAHYRSLAALATRKLKCKPSSKSNARTTTLISLRPNQAPYMSKSQSRRSQSFLLPPSTCALEDRIRVPSNAADNASCRMIDDDSGGGDNCKIVESSSKLSDVFISLAQASSHIASLNHYKPFIQLNDRMNQSARVDDEDNDFSLLHKQQQYQHYHQPHYEESMDDESMELHLMRSAVALGRAEKNRMLHVQRKELKMRNVNEHHKMKMIEGDIKSYISSILQCTSSSSSPPPLNDDDNNNRSCSNLKDELQKTQSQLQQLRDWNAKQNQSKSSIRQGTHRALSAYLKSSSQ